MKNNTKLSLKEEVEKESNRIEERIANCPSLNIEVTCELDKSLYRKIEEYDAKHFNEHLSEELVPNFSERTNDNSEFLLSEEDKEALRLGRELMKRNETLHKVNTELHKQLNYEKERIHAKNKSHKNNEET